SSQIGNGFSVQVGSVWSKSLTQSVTGGCSGMMLAESDIGAIPLLGSFRSRWINRSRDRLFLGYFDRDLGAVALGEPGLVFQARGHGPFADFVRVAEFVEIEQFRRQ